MIGNILSNRTLFTILTRVVIAAINFLLVIFTTRVWGDEGRGIIALIMASVSIITIFNNVSSGSTISFHAPKISVYIIYSLAFPLTFFTSLLGAVIFYFFRGGEYFQFVFITAVLISYATSISLFRLGENNILQYNLFSLLPQVMTLVFLMLLYYVFKISTINAYFFAYYISYGIAALTGFYVLFRKKRFRFVFDIDKYKQILGYGFKSETSYLLQFLNSRLSYFFISAWLGLAKLGIFSVAVAVSEAILILSRSISSVHYSNVINSNDVLKKIKMTDNAVISSFVLSLLAFAILYFIPDYFFVYLFGNDFTEVKQLIIYLFPGIIAVAVSNIYGHYFSGIGKMWILIVKSLIGLIITLILLLVLLKKLDLVGACITVDVAYISSSVYLFLKYRSEKREIEEI